MEIAYGLIVFLEVVLIVICIVCEIMEAIYPETKAFEKIRVFVFLASIPIFIFVFQFFGYFIDFSIVLDFIKDIPELIEDMFDMFRGCPYP